MNVDNNTRALTVYVTESKKTNAYNTLKEYYERFLKVCRNSFSLRRREYLVFAVEFFFFLLLGVFFCNINPFVCVIIYRVCLSKYFVFFYICLMLLSALSGFTFFGRAVPFCLNAIIAFASGSLQFSVMFGIFTQNSWRTVLCTVLLSVVSFCGLILSSEIFYNSRIMIRGKTNNISFKKTIIYICFCIFTIYILFLSFNTFFNNLMAG